MKKWSKEDDGNFLIFILAIEKYIKGGNYWSAFKFELEAKNAFKQIVLEHPDIPLPKKKECDAMKRRVKKKWIARRYAAGE